MIDRIVTDMGECIHDVINAEVDAVEFYLVHGAAQKFDQVRQSVLIR